MSQFKDYPAGKIQAKLEQVKAFEAKYGANSTTQGWYKWCTDYNYRKREWELRQSVTNSIEHGYGLRKIS